VTVKSLSPPPQYVAGIATPHVLYLRVILSTFSCECGSDIIRNIRKCKHSSTTPFNYIFAYTASTKKDNLTEYHVLTNEIQQKQVPANPSMLNEQRIHHKTRLILDSPTATRPYPTFLNNLPS
jgi:hypothetical protein